MDSNYDQLISKVDEFIQKFYLNKILRGTIYASAVLLVLYLILFLCVYYFNPEVSIKTVLFFSFILVGITLVGFLIIKPTLAYFKLGSKLNLQQAALLIGNHFLEVKDRIINTMQLKELADKNPNQSMLIMAGIDQKIMELRPIPFTSAIKLDENRQYLKYLLAPLSIIIFIAVISPSVLREGTRNLVQYDKKILPKSPFQFVLLNQNLLVTQGDDLTVKIRLTGNKIPQEVYITDGTNTYRLEREGKTRFSYMFKNMQKNKSISFSGGGFSSPKFSIIVNPRPLIANITAVLNYPDYLRKKAETVKNAGDLLIPEGTVVSWQLKTQNSDRLNFTLGEKTHTLLRDGNLFNFASPIRSSTIYQVIPENGSIKSRDAFSHQITVIKDEYPAIKISETVDSLSSKTRYFSGNVSDDHGFTKLTFHYNIRENGVVTASYSKSLSIKPTVQEDAFFFLWSLNEIPTRSGQLVEYYFEVADNDAINGPKKSKSDIKFLQLPTSYQLSDKIDQGNDVVKQKLGKAVKLAETIEKESKKLGESLLDKKNLSFEDKKGIERLLEKQKQLEGLGEEIKNLNEKHTFEKQENNILKDELTEKQRQIDDLFQNALDGKTKALLEELQKLMDQQNQDKARNELSKVQMDNKTVKNELDRILELYKQLEFEQKLQITIDQLKDLAKAQKELAEKARAKESIANELTKQQTELSLEFEKVEKQLEKLAEKNEALERPNEYSIPQNQIEEIKQKQRNSKESLQKEDKNEAAQSQNEASEQMEKLAQKMEEGQQESDAARNKVNAQELRQLLENLLNSSFNQEKVMLSLKGITSVDPQYTSLVQKQRNLKDNVRIIADSLFSLSKRIPQIESTVNEEMQKINFNIDKSIEYLGERNTSLAIRGQQYTMTSINNLSLMLNEALEQVQNASKEGQQGNSKGSKNSMQQLKEMQQRLNENMQKAKDQLQKSGNQGQIPKGQMSQEFGKMAQQQQMIREALQKINNQNKNGNGGQGNPNELIKEMRNTETDLVNKRIEQVTMERQKKLLDKLLDAENAEREEEEDTKRESKAAKDFPPSYKKMVDHFKKTQQSQIESIQKLPPDLNHYYKNKIAEYYKMLNSADK